MSLKSVYYGPNLKRIPVGSYISNIIVSRGIGGIIRPRHFFVPATTKKAGINTQLNVLDTSLAEKKSEFNLPKEKDDNLILKADIGKTFSPIPLTSLEITKLSNKRKAPEESKKKQSQKIKIIVLT
jgi:hypothetical protein